MPNISRGRRPSETGLKWPIIKLDDQLDNHTFKAHFSYIIVQMIGTNRILENCRSLAKYKCWKNMIHLFILPRLRVGFLDFSCIAAGILLVNFKMSEIVTINPELLICESRNVICKFSNFYYGSHRDWKTGETWKMGRHFPVREKSGNFVKTGKVREICQSEKVGTMHTDRELRRSQFT